MTIGSATGPAPLRMGIVGCGAVTELCHLPALARDIPFRVTALVDRIAEQTERAADRYRSLRGAKGAPAGPAPTLARDVDDVLDLIDVAIVATGPDSHAALAVQLATAGKPVLLEKPIAGTVAECVEIDAAAAATGVKVVPAHVRRLYPAAAWVAERLASGRLGTVRRVRWREGAAYGWPAVSAFTFDAGTGGGVLADLGPHIVDLLAYWFGSLEPVGLADNSAGGAASEARLELHAGDVKIEVELSMLRDLENTIVIEGSLGMLRLGTERAAGYEMLTAVGDLLDKGGIPAADPATLTREGLFHRQLVEFDRALRGHGSTAATFAQASAGVDLLQRIREHRTGHLARPWESRRREPVGLRRVAVTGATGFIGAHVIDRLLQDDQTTVVALARTPPRRRARLSHWDSARLTVEPADLLGDPAVLVDAFRDCDVVIHAAYGNAGEPAQRWAVSVDGTAAVLAAARKAGVRRLVHTSSLSVYTPTGPVIDEHSALILADPEDLSYAQQKLAAERLVLSSAQDRMEVVCVQPTVVYGPWGPLWTVRPLRRLAADNTCLPGGDKGSCDVVHVHDVADAIAFLAAAPDAAGERFLLSGPERVTWGAFYDHYRDMLRLPLLRLADSPDWADRDRAFYGGSPPVDTSRLAALGFRSRIDLQSGMDQVARWARWAGLT